MLFVWNTSALPWNTHSVHIIQLRGVLWACLVGRSEVGQCVFCCIWGWVVLSLSTACCQLLVLPSEFCTPRMGLTDFSHRTKSWIIPCKACCRQEQMHSFCKNSWIKMSAETTAFFLTGEANESRLRYWPYLSAAHSSSKGQWAAEEEPGAAS